MHIGMIGLGRMGANLVCRLMKGGHICERALGLLERGKG